jgi:hypothetical protein
MNEAADILINVGTVAAALAPVCLVIMIFKSARWGKFAMVLLIAGFGSCTLGQQLREQDPEEALKNSEGLVARVNGEIPGFDACVRGGESFVLCCNKARGEYSPHGTTDAGRPKSAGPPECRKTY